MARPPGKRVVVALDGNASVRPCLQVAVELAQLMHSELLLLFVLQDDGLQQLAELPFAVEISRVTADARGLSVQTLEREQRYRSRLARREFDRVLLQSGLSGSFRVVSQRRGKNIFSMCKRGDVACIGRNPLQLDCIAPRVTLTLYLVHHKSKAGKHALNLAHRLLARGFHQLVVFDNGELDRESRRRLRAENIRIQSVADHSLAALLAGIKNRSSARLLIPDDAPIAEDREQLLAAIAARRLDTLIVH